MNLPPCCCRIFWRGSEGESKNSLPVVRRGPPDWQRRARACTSIPHCPRLLCVRQGLLEADSIVMRRKIRLYLIVNLPLPAYPAPSPTCLSVWLCQLCIRSCSALRLSAFGQLRHSYRGLPWLACSGCASLLRAYYQKEIKRQQIFFQLVISRAKKIPHGKNQCGLCGLWCVRN